MKNHSLNLHGIGSAFHSHNFVTANGFHSIHPIHRFYMISHGTYMPHPIHRIYAVSHTIHMMHPLHRVCVFMVGVYMQHAGHWASDYAAALAFLLTCIFSYLLYMLLTSTQIHDYTTGVWALFG